MSVRILAVIAMFVAAPAWLHSQDDSTFRTYVAADYDPKRLRVTRRQFTHGDATIEVIQARKIARDNRAPFSCRAWLTVSVAGRPVFLRYYADMDAGGAEFGLFVPPSSAQVPAPFFAVLKIGDYNGRLFLIRTDGRVFDMPGGLYILSADRRQLFSEHHSDASKLIVFDLATSERVFESGELPSIHHWYEVNGSYAFTESEWRQQDKGTAHEKEGVLHRYNAATRNIISQTGPYVDLRGAQKLEYTFNPHDYPSCTVAP
jgi:hypothetical protein